VIVRWGWGAKNKGLTVSFIKAIDYTLTVDGDATDDYTAGEPSRQADGYWWVFWYFEVRTLAAGDSVELTLDYSLAHKLTDGSVDPVTGHLVHAGPGSIAYGECTITAE